MEPTFYICRTCGNVVVKLTDSGAPLSCCGKKMDALTANTTDAAKEKHVPVVNVEGQTVNVQVGSTLHPMTEEHLIQWIVLVCSDGTYQMHALSAGDQPKASFALADGQMPESVFAYCNLHGLWKAEV